MFTTRAVTLSTVALCAPRGGRSLTRETPPRTVALTRTSLGGVMGSIVEFSCRSCGFTTENLRVGWGKEGRTRFWGGLGVCPAGTPLTVVDLTAKPGTHRSQQAQGQ